MRARARTVGSGSRDRQGGNRRHLKHLRGIKALGRRAPEEPPLRPLQRWRYRGAMAGTNRRRYGPRPKKKAPRFHITADEQARRERVGAFIRRRRETVLVTNVEVGGFAVVCAVIQQRLEVEPQPAPIAECCEESIDRCPDAPNQPALRKPAVDRHVHRMLRFVAADELSEVASRHRLPPPSLVCPLQNRRVALRLLAHLVFLSRSLHASARADSWL